MSFPRYDAEVRLSGRLDQTVKRFGLSAAEIVVLRQIHGHDAVVNPVPTKIDVTVTQDEELIYPDNFHEEYRRLVSIYGDGRLDNTFPGFQKVLPAKLNDIQNSEKETTSYSVMGSNQVRGGAKGLPEDVDASSNVVTAGATPKNNMFGRATLGGPHKSEGGAV